MKINTKKNIDLTKTNYPRSKLAQTHLQTHKKKKKKSALNRSQEAEVQPQDVLQATKKCPINGNLTV